MTFSDTQPKPWLRGPRPHRWKTGPDPLRHQQYQAYVQQRNQALFRGEGWTLTFDEWCDIWGDRWSERGRERGSSCMSRRDWHQPWTRENVIIVTRVEHARMAGRHRVTRS